MKFLTLIATASAVTLSRRHHDLAQTTGPNDEARDVIAECDADSDGKLSKKEVIDCATAKAPK